MRQKKVKAIRKQVYGDFSQKQVKKYVWGKGKNGGLHSTGLRRAYLEAKKNVGKEEGK